MRHVRPFRSSTSTSPSSRAAFAAAALLASASALPACAVPSEPGATAAEGALTGDPSGGAANAGAPGAGPLDGLWFTQASNPLGGFARLGLGPDHHFVVKVDVSASALCAPQGTETRCLVERRGTFALDASGATLELAFEEDGAVIERERMGVTRTADVLRLARRNRIEKLSLLPAGRCASDVDCASGQSCPPAACSLHCEIDDTSCCEPQVCRPTPSAPEAGSCWGAWRDQNDTCRAPHDGVYPAACCAGL